MKILKQGKKSMFVNRQLALVGSFLGLIGAKQRLGVLSLVVLRCFESLSNWSREIAATPRSIWLFAHDIRQPGLGEAKKPLQGQVEGQTGTTGR